ncbi:MAG: acetolactate synthase large subunit [Alicyclobacillus herbarius]|uniref:acetolactate synthase large subunit n=1 Tax=Alicyclobacillus herbarius TaxID=122960 RepID=UPI00235709BC|nr:acetolactate synthase large subunit [Alicyclobacillus herbarius]MCL6633475.1 acetolactate synthase large subunit [Alicyclobacillus herbarius]
MKASDLLVRCLEAEGVEYIFGIPGEENIDLMDSLTRSSIRFILTRHEQAAAFMADVYGRLTGRPGVCLATLGPGATNLITGVANAHLDRSPLVAITGQAERTRLHKESHQNVDTIQLFKGITKYDQQILSPRIIPEVVRKAFSLAASDNPGAVHLQLPEDVARAEVEGRPLPIGRFADPYPDGYSLREAARLIMNAERPIILAGNGVIRNHAAAEVQQLVEEANVPLVNTFMAKGILPFVHPLNLFTVGGKPYPTGLRPLHEADLVIAIGFDLVEYDPATWNADGRRRVLHIHNVPAETDAHFPVELDLVGDLRYTLRALADMVGHRPDPYTHLAIRSRRLDALSNPPSPNEALAHHVMWTLTERLPENAVVISDVGLHKVWTARWYQPKQAGRTLIFNGLAAMGGALPGGVAARLACPDAPVVILSGDGGFLMNSQELETAKRLGTDFLAIVFNDKRYSLIERKQQDAGLAVTAVAFDNPDFRLYAESFGVSYRRAADAASFTRALDGWLREGGLTLLEVQLR